ncbi:hypothetical protein AB1A81_11150 [Bdellovibrio bacteriovorus]|uniref:hypothetical protein n=1 Tax=Bdellovibrio bacteriovorus TaxID=959 RepID=UPI00031D0203|nr:hypothetical protein [Bdellovibrio bacteriovorus]
MLKLVKTAVLFLCAFATAMAATADRAYAWGKKRSTSASEFISNKRVTDSLVQDLTCNKLSIEGIYYRIKDDAFHESRNMPITNWPFRSGVATIAGCWALSSTQRMISYMARYNEPTSLRMDQISPGLLNQIRGGTLELVNDNRNNDNYALRSSSERIITRSLKANSVFPVPSNSLAEDKWHTNSLWMRLLEGHVENVDGRNVHRHFRAEIEENQARHFFRASNIGMGAGSGDRSASKNQETVATMRRNAETKRLTLVNLRAGRTAQHIVMVKSYKATKDMITFTVYDSNQPSKDQLLYYSVKNSAFYAPDIVSRFVLENTSRSLGVYVVDEDEREMLEDAMLAYYRVKCR